MSSFTETLVQQITPVVVSVVVSIAGAIAIWLSSKVNDFFDIQNAEKREKLERLVSEALHSAALNGLKYAAAKLDGDIIGKLDINASPPEELIDLATSYVQEMMPDTIDKTNLAENELKKIITSKLPDLINLIRPAATIVSNG